MNDIKCRPINPMTSELGKSCQLNLQVINKDFRKETNAIRWINTGFVIRWFNFVIGYNRTKTLFNEVIQWAELYGN